MKVTSFNPTHGIKGKSHRKENHFVKEYAVITAQPKTKELYLKGRGDAYDNPITLRIYSTISTTYVCLWIFGKGASGSGKATGYGYHRASSAAEQAIKSAGITLSEPIDARGDSAIKSALSAIAEHLGYKKYYIHEAHG